MMNKDIYIAARFLTQPITGVQRYGIELSKAIKKLNTEYNITFIAPQNIIHHEIAKFLDVKQIGSLKGQLWDQISLLKFLKSKGSPLILNFSNTLPVFYENKIVTIHDIIHLKYPVSYSYRKYYEIVFPLMLKHSKHIITVSEFSKKEISSYFGIDESKISIVYNGVDEKFKPKKLENQERYILGVSSIAYHKNFISLIKAFLQLKDKSIKLYIVGGLNEKIFGKNSSKVLDYIKTTIISDFWEELMIINLLSYIQMQSVLFIHLCMKGLEFHHLKLRHADVRLFCLIYQFLRKFMEIQRYILILKIL